MMQIIENDNNQGQSRLEHHRQATLQNQGHNLNHLNTKQFDSDTDNSFSE